MGHRLAEPDAVAKGCWSQKRLPSVDASARSTSATRTAEIVPSVGPGCLGWGPHFRFAWRNQMLHAAGPYLLYSPGSTSREHYSAVAKTADFKSGPPTSVSLRGTEVRLTFDTVITGGDGGFAGGWPGSTDLALSDGRIAAIADDLTSATATRPSTRPGLSSSPAASTPLPPRDLPAVEVGHGEETESSLVGGVTSVSATSAPGSTT